MKKELKKKKNRGRERREEVLCVWITASHWPIVSFIRLKIEQASVAKYKSIDTDHIIVSIFTDELRTTGTNSTRPIVGHGSQWWPIWNACIKYTVSSASKNGTCRHAAIPNHFVRNIFINYLRTSNFFFFSSLFCGFIHLTRRFWVVFICWPTPGQPLVERAVHHPSNNNHHYHYLSLLKFLQILNVVYKTYLWYARNTSAIRWARDCDHVMCDDGIPDLQIALHLTAHRKEGFASIQILDPRDWIAHSVKKTKHVTKRKKNEIIIWRNEYVWWCILTSTMRHIHYDLLLLPKFIYVIAELYT